VSTYWLRIHSTVISWWVHIGWEYNPLSFYGEYILVERTIHKYILTMRYQWIVFSTNMHSPWDDWIVFSTNMYSSWDTSGLYSQPICTHHDMTVDCILNQYVLTMRWLRIQSTGISRWVHIGLENNPQSSHGFNTIHSHLIVSTYWLRIQSTVISWWVHIGWEYVNYFFSFIIFPP
jgi:hypothetical protein